MNLYHDFKRCTPNMSLTFNSSRSLNDKSVWAFYLLFIIIYWACFCNLNIPSYLKPQHSISNCKWESASESCIDFIENRGRYLLSWFIMPSIWEILFTFFYEYELHFMKSFIVKPKEINFQSLNEGFHVSISLFGGYEKLLILSYQHWESLLTRSQSDI